MCQTLLLLLLLLAVVRTGSTQPWEGRYRQRQAAEATWRYRWRQHITQATLVLWLLLQQLELLLHQGVTLLQELLLLMLSSSSQTRCCCCRCCVNSSMSTRVAARMHSRVASTSGRHLLRHRGVHHTTRLTCVLSPMAAVAIVCIATSMQVMSRCRRCCYCCMMHCARRQRHRRYAIVVPSTGQAS